MRLKALVLILAFVFVGCVSRLPGPAIPASALFEVDEKEKETVVQSVKDYTLSLKQLKGARGYARVRLDTKGKIKNLDELILIFFPENTPPSFRFETLDDFGNPHFVLLSDGKQLEWQDLDRSEISTEILEEKTLKRFLPIFLNLSKTLGLLIGKLDLSFENDPLLAVLKNREANPEFYHLYFATREIVWSTQEKTIVRWIEKNHSGKSLFIYEAKDFHILDTSPPECTHLVGGVAVGPTGDSNCVKDKSGGFSFKLPTKIYLKDFKNKTFLDLEYLQMKITSVLPKP